MKNNKSSYLLCHWNITVDIYCLIREHFKIDVVYTLDINYAVIFTCIKMVAGPIAEIGWI